MVRPGRAYSSCSVLSSQRVSVLLSHFDPKELFVHYKYQLVDLAKEPKFRLSFVFPPLSNTCRCLCYTLTQLIK